QPHLHVLSLQPSPSHVTVVTVEINPDARPPEPLRHQQRRAAPNERVQDHAAAGAVVVGAGAGGVEAFVYPRVRAAFGIPSLADSALLCRRVVLAHAAPQVLGMVVPTPADGSSDRF